MFIRVMTKIYIFTISQSYTTPYIRLVTSGFFCEVDKDIALLDYVASSGKFWDNLLVPSSRGGTKGSLQESSP
jgi:hypothetical protein